MPVAYDAQRPASVRARRTVVTVTVTSTAPAWSRLGDLVQARWTRMSDTLEST